MSDNRETQPRTPPLVREKLAAFDRLEPDFEASFTYVEQMHGEQRFTRVPVDDIVRYLHSLWVCDCKDALLSVPLTIPRYDRHRALDLMLTWQDGTSAAVVAFLEQKLDMLTFAQLTRQIEQAGTAENLVILARLRHGMEILVNRGLNLHHALESIIALSTGELQAQVRAACARYGHMPEQIREQRSLFDTPLYSYLPHQELAQRNMLVMNRLGVRITDTPADRPGRRTARVSAPEQPLPSYARLPLAHQTTFTPPPYSTSPYIPTNVPPPAVIGAEQVVAGS